MEISKLRRDPDRVHATIIENGDSLVTKTGCRIYIPKRFEEKKLATVGEETHITSIFAMVVENQYYSTSMACATMQITPDITSVVKIGDVEYYEFIFNPGSTITPNVNLVTVSTLVYYIYNEILAKVKVPWYMNYDDLGGLLESAKHHADIRLAPDNIPLEIIAAIVSRNNQNVNQPYRLIREGRDDVFTSPPMYVPINSVLTQATNTTAKLMGNRFDEGLTAALIDPVEDRVDTVETILRL